MVVLTSIFVAEIKGPHAIPELLEDELLLASDKNALEGVRELVSMYEGKNRIEPID